MADAHVSVYKARLEHITTHQAAYGATERCIHVLISHTIVTM